nr:hypothetical protein [Candidatus Microthrix sp.]
MHSPTTRWPPTSIIFALGFFYFTLVTALSTTLQEEVDDEHRGRVMGLWMIAWAGLVPVGSLLAGPVIDKVGGTPVLLFGAVVALALTKVGNLDRNQLPERRPLTRPLPTDRLPSPATRLPLASAASPSPAGSTPPPHHPVGPQRSRRASVPTATTSMPRLRAWDTIS